MNVTLRGVLGSPMVAALISFLVGSLALAAVLLVTARRWPARAQLRLVPAWAWFGGVLGAFYVASSIVVGRAWARRRCWRWWCSGSWSPRWCVDHFGWLGFAQHPLTLMRLVGAALLFCGVLLIVR